MHVLMLVQGEQRTIFSSLYNAISHHCTLDLRRVSSNDQANLEKYFKTIQIADYDRIIFFLRFKKESRQLAFIRTIPNLVILEMDAWQNYYPHSKYEGKFSRHYRGLPWARQLVSGYSLSKKLQAEGFDAQFVPKGYDDTVLKNLNIKRDIELGFIGSLNNKMYVKRREILTAAQERFGLTITKTASGKEYMQMLNRIQFFISCDYGFGEYMIKNFEAMACGCVLFAWNQGEEENNALGFIDMHNIVLYTSLEEIENKLMQLRRNPNLTNAIAKNGQALAAERYGFSLIGKKIVESLQKPLIEKESTLLWWDKLRYCYYR